MADSNWKVSLIAAALGLLVAAFSLSRTGVLHEFELRSFDQLFRLRYALAGPEPIDERIVVLGVDEACFALLKKPFLLWMPDFARVVEGLNQAGAVAVGVDVIFHPELDSESQDEAVAFLSQTLADHELGLGVAVAQGPNVLIEVLNPDTGEVEVGPSEMLAAFALRPEGGDGRANLGIANIYVDSDGITRRLPLSFVSEGERQGEVRNFSMRLLELATGRTLAKTPDGQVRLGPVPIPTENGYLRLNFPRPPVADGESAFPSVPLSSLLAPGADFSRFAGKICLIGPQAQSFQDYRPSPYAPLNLGVDIHATAVNTVLTGRFVEPAPPGAWVLCLLLAAVSSALVTLRLEVRGAALCLVGLAALYLLVAVGVFSGSGMLLPTAATLMAGLLGTGAGYLQRQRTVEADRRQIRSTFGRMVSKQVMEAVLRDPSRISAGTEREVTVLFSDINNFTPICERHDPAELIVMLGDYFSLMVEVILRHDGYIKQYVGDEIMVIFGAPEDQPDHAQRAVLCGVDMLEALNRRAREREGVPGFYDVKIGVNTGKVVVGKVGPEDRWEYAAVGDDVNLGARVMGLTKSLGTKMLVSAKTRQAIGDSLPQVEWVSRGEQQFKGKTQRLEVFEVRRVGEGSTQ